MGSRGGRGSQARQENNDVQAGQFMKGKRLGEAGEDRGGFSVRSVD